MYQKTLLQKLKYHIHVLKYCLCNTYKGNVSNQSDCGEIICWGENNYGQLSLSPDVIKVIVDPYIVNMQHFEGRVIDVQTGWTHVLALTGQLSKYFTRKKTTVKEANDVT